MNARWSVLQLLYGRSLGTAGSAPERLHGLGASYPRLGGQRLEEIAIALLRGRSDFGSAIHYREWFNLLRQAGHHVAGKDPLATFLAQLNRSASIERVGQRSGLYRLRCAA